MSYNILHWSIGDQQKASHDCIWLMRQWAKCNQKQISALTTGKETGDSRDSRRGSYARRRAGGRWSRCVCNGDRTAHKWRWPP